MGENRRPSGTRGIKKALAKGGVEIGRFRIRRLMSDRGSEYGANGFRGLLRQNCLRQSMSGKGNCCGNAPAESLLFRFKAEVNRRWNL
jgi:transposase InsO family protein